MNSGVGIKIAIVDDEQLFVNQLQQYLKRYSAKSGQQFFVSVFGDGMNFASDYTVDYDIIFLDIEMPLMNGIDTAKYLRTRDEEVCIIFITNMSQYALKGYEVQAMDYLVKPLKEEIFEERLKKAIAYCEKYKNNSFVLSHGGEQIRVNYKDVLYVESQKHYVYYHLKTGVVKIRAMLRDVDKNLLEKGFAYCSGSCIVNMAYVVEVKKTYVKVEDELLPVSRLCQKEFMKNLTLYFGQKL